VLVYFQSSLNSKEGRSWNTSVIPATKKAEIGGWWAEVSLGKIIRPYLKNKGWGIPQGVKCLPSKHEVLSTDPSTAKKKKKKKR
jgi:hypothetical protein